MIFRRRPSASSELLALVPAQETLLTHASALDGRAFGVTRERLLITGEPPVDLPWALVAKAALSTGDLVLTPLRPVASWELGEGRVVDVMRDAEPIHARFGASAGLTDQIHHRVRKSVAGSAQVADGSGWVTLRRVAGRDGLVAQLRLNPGVEIDLPGLGEQALAAFRTLNWPAQLAQR